MDDLVKMIGPNGPDDVAIVRPEWVDQWRGYGYVTEEDAAELAKAAADNAAADKAAADAAAKAAAGKKD